MTKIIKTNYGDDRIKIILDQLNPNVESVGIVVSDLLGTVESYEFYHGLCSVENNIRMAIIPVHHENLFRVLLPPDVLGVYIYNSKPVISAIHTYYDVWIEIHEDRVIVINNLSDSGDKLVIGNQMKSTLSPIEKSDGAADILFSYKSLASRTYNDRWIEYPNTVDRKVLIGSLLSVINEHESDIRTVIESVKTDYQNQNLTFGTIKMYTPISSGIRVVLRQNYFDIKYITFQIGDTLFNFPVTLLEKDWFELMKLTLEDDFRS